MIYIAQSRFRFSIKGTDPARQRGGNLGFVQPWILDARTVRYGTGPDADAGAQAGFEAKEYDTSPSPAAAATGLSDGGR